QESISELKVAIAKIKDGMYAFFISQKVVSNELNNLKNGECTSNNAQNSGSQHQSGGGGGQIYRNGNHSYGRLAKIMFLKFSGDDVNSWIYKCLKVEISSHIRMFTLDTLNDVYYLAKMQEQTIMDMKSRYGPVLNTPKPVSNVFNKSATGYQRSSGTNVVMPNASLMSNAPFRKRLTQKELEEKRENHMCFYCDEKYFPCHKYSGQLHSLEVIINEEEDKGEEVFEECVTNKDKTEHFNHLKCIMQVMRENTLYAKQSKYAFVVLEVKYLGHVVSAKGVATDKSKIQAMKEWPIPKTVKQLKGFLGLTGYYRRFIRHYAIISKLLTRLLKKQSFQWSVQAQTAFETLKIAMIKSLVLSLPQFQKELIVETDACDTCIGAVLQGDMHFKIKSDHFSLKYLLDQRVTTPFQAKWLPKLLGFDNEISYKKGSENMVADALSRVLKNEEVSQMFSLITATITSPLWE
nr:hypothetical protein [Tanacetum cinerariifolium]